ncbi:MULTISPECIES: tyrosine-type recombinase/integrase [unclassified Bradyrhizobium]|uniref:tyrosine-type recombinase/integrase n=1 Tax=unclassified Bradyrhizobium TaxID=2631580 RepID=UPI0028E587E1|nr:MULTISPECIES: tyrosine-type recombinase/integrase [unclassified Bradyrhizobium]
MPPIDQRYYYEDRDRHGNLRRYFRKRIPTTGRFRKVRLREELGTAAFHEEFAAAMAGRPYQRPDAPPRPPAPPRVVERSLRWLIQKYYRECLEFRGYDVETQKNRRRILDALCREPVQEGAEHEVGDLPCDIPKSKIQVLINRKALTSINSANHRLKALRKLSEWAVKTEPRLMTANVAKEVELLDVPKTGGHHTWRIEEILQFKQRHPVGSKAYLALALFMLTGQRLSDVARMGRPHIRKAEHMSPLLRQVHPGRWLDFRQRKNRTRSPVDLVIPILPQLEAVLTASPLGELTFLETEHKRPFTTKGLGNWFEKRCIEAGVPGRAHGLRKAGATIAAENGATPHQLKAIFGWKTLQQAELYTEKVRQQLLAGGAMGLITFTGKI